MSIKHPFEIYKIIDDVIVATFIDIIVFFCL